MACHYPHFIHLRWRVSNPSHSHKRRCQPRQLVYQSGRKEMKADVQKFSTWFGIGRIQPAVENLNPDANAPQTF
jgi:hypothetical protein